MQNSKNIAVIALILLIAIGLLRCYPTIKKEPQTPQESLIPVRFFYPTFRDDMDMGSLTSAIKRTMAYLERLGPEHMFHYGPHKFTCQEVRESHQAFLLLIKSNPDLKQLTRAIKKHFLVYRAAGRVGNNQVLFTGYFEPVYQGSLTPDEVFTFPLYRKPEDLIRIDLSAFNRRFEGETITARAVKDKIIPYYTRSQIDQEKALAGKDLEIAWLRDPVDVAFLHIQGSGRLELPDGTTAFIGYAGSNGRPYRSIGKYMLKEGYLTKEEMSMQAIRKYLREHPEHLEKVLNYNPSYIFFRVLESGPLGNIGVPLTPGRSLALDSRLFPKGALAFISSSKPTLNDKGEITEWKSFSRFVLNQDTGGAIKGTGRADLFWGSGPFAEMAAGHMKHDGELYIFIKRP